MIRIVPSLEESFNVAKVKEIMTRVMQQILSGIIYSQIRPFLLLTPLRQQIHNALQNGGRLGVRQLLQARLARSR